MSAEVVLFQVFALLALFSAAAMVALAGNAVASAMSLVVTIVSLAGIFVLLGADFLGVVQIMIYAGAIMVLVVFVVMLLEAGRPKPAPPSRSRTFVKLLGCAAAAGIAVLLISVIPPGSLPGGAPAEAIGGYREIGLALFTDFVVPLEVVGLLLLSAVVGAVILAKQRIG
jgi:NADH-quinone oxidoreductase subunit J